jgi:hypothetical protein
MMQSTTSFLEQPVVTWPAKAPPSRFIAEPVSVRARLSENAEERNSSWMTLLSSLIFNILRIGIFLAIVLWPWETAE